eukprot:2468608-Pleurochrysis_carterae.AAC.1
MAEHVTMTICSETLIMHSSKMPTGAESFGRWKNRWRFLLRASYNRHNLTNHLIYTFMILHNMCTIHMGNEVKGMHHPLHNAHAMWSSYSKEYKADVCPTCKRAKIKHCLHVVQNRNGAHKQEVCVGQTAAIAILSVSICGMSFLNPQGRGDEPSILACAE